MYNPNKMIPGAHYTPRSNARCIPYGTTREKAEFLARKARLEKDIENGVSLNMALHRFWHLPLDWK